MSSPFKSAAAVLGLMLAVTAPPSASAADAMRVVRDPATGELRAPNAAEALAFEKAEAQLRAGRAAAGGKVDSRKINVDVRHADGSIETPLGDDTMMYSVVKEAADGTLTMDCLPAKEARKFVKSSKKSSAGKAEGRSDHAHE